MMTIHELLDADELSTLRTFLDSAHFDSGKATAGGAAAKLKENLQANREQQGISQMDRLVMGALQRSRELAAYAWPRKVTAPIYAKYTSGMSYGKHLDAAVMASDGMRTDLSVTVFLSEPKEYKGGELVLELGGDCTHEVKLSAGSAFVYPTSMIHEVKPVMSGTRLVVVLWVQSYARDPLIREALSDLRRVGQLDHDRPSASLLQKAVTTFQRYFAEP